MKNNFFETTNRLILRSPKQSDAKFLAEKRGNEFITRFNLYKPCSHEQILKEFENFEHFILTLKDSQEIIGAVSVKDDPFRYHVEAKTLQAWLVQETAYKGYMAEALEVILEELFIKRGLEIVSVHIFGENKASMRLAEKLGFEREGYIKRAVKKDNGDVFDLAIYALDRNEYLEKKK